MSGGDHSISSLPINLGKSLRATVGTNGPDGDKGSQSRLNSVVSSLDPPDSVLFGELHPMVKFHRDCQLRAKKIAWKRYPEGDTLTVIDRRTGRYKSRKNVEMLSFMEHEVARLCHRGLRRALESRPTIRTRLSGVVGPEPDWSVIYSDLSRYIFNERNGKRFFNSAVLRTDLVGPLDRDGSFPTWRGRLLFPKTVEETLTGHETLHTCFMDRQAVLDWTEFAHLNGVEFHGKRGYRMPGTNLDPIGAFRRLRREGYYSRHKRSNYARITRSARRGKSEALISPMPVERLFVTRPVLPMKEIRKGWYYNNPNKLRWKEFLALQEKAITLFPKQCRSPIPGIVYGSLKKIYSKPQRFSEVRPWFSKVDEDLKYVLQLTPTKQITRKFLLRKGAIIKTHRLDLELRTADLLHSTIPRVRAGDPRFKHWDWKLNAFDNTLHTSVPEDYYVDSDIDSPPYEGGLADSWDDPTEFFERTNRAFHQSIKDWNW